MVTSEHSGGPKQARREMFYRDGLSQAEQVDLEKAAEVENLGEEIALLRVRLKTALSERPRGLRAAGTRGRDIDAGGGDAIPAVASGIEGPGGESRRDPGQVRGPDRARGPLVSEPRYE